MNTIFMIVVLTLIVIAGLVVAYQAGMLHEYRRVSARLRALSLAAGADLRAKAASCVPTSEFYAAEATHRAYLTAIETPTDSGRE